MRGEFFVVFWCDRRTDRTADSSVAVAFAPAALGM